MNLLTKIKKQKWIHYLPAMIVALATVIVAISSPGRTDSYILEKMGIAMILAMSLSFVVGFLGELSLGHAGFMCLGAFIGGKVASLLVPSLGNSVLTLIIAMIVGGIVAAIAGAIIGIPALRLKGDYLAIVTLAFGEIVRVLFQNSSKTSFGGAFGLETPRYDYHSLYIIIFVVAVLSILVFTNIIRSKHGRAVTAIRDSEIAARATGINVTKYKILVFIISSFFAGVAGVLYSYTQSKVQSVNFTYNYSIEILVMVVLGGMGNMNGSIIAGVVITFLKEKLATQLTGNLAILQNIIYSLILIIIVIYNNAPKLKSFREKYSISQLTAKLFKTKNDPTIVKADEGKWDRVPTKIDMNEVLSIDVNVVESVQQPDKPDNTKEDNYE